MDQQAVDCTGTRISFTKHGAMIGTVQLGQNDLAVVNIVRGLACFYFRQTQMLAVAGSELL